jgi:hypothetical protein
MQRIRAGDLMHQHNFCSSSFNTPAARPRSTSEWRFLHKVSRIGQFRLCFRLVSQREAALAVIPGSRHGDRGIPLLHEIEGKEEFFAQEIRSEWQQGVIPQAVRSRSEEAYGPCGKNRITKLLKPAVKFPPTFIRDSNSETQGTIAHRRFRLS